MIIHEEWNFYLQFKIKIVVNFYAKQQMTHDRISNDFNREFHI